MMDNNISWLQRLYDLCWPLCPGQEEMMLSDFFLLFQLFFLEFIFLFAFIFSSHFCLREKDVSQAYFAAILFVIHLYNAYNTY